MTVDEPTFQTLNAIYLRKMADAEHVASVTGMHIDDVTKQLEEQAEAMRLIKVDSNYLMLPDGVSEVLAFYHHSYADLRDPSGYVMPWYERFEQTLNVQFIKAVSQWQTSEGDERAADRMMRIVDRMIRALSELTSGIPRYAGYIRRFERSMALADQGKLEYVCKPTLDSMHNIWFEFHEDILAVVGRPRDQ